MKKLATLLLLAIGFTGTQAQTTALDFTANDCAGMSHTLFSDLDAGNAVVIDLVMMGCPSCGPATQSISANVLPNVSDPSRVKFYSVGFTNSITCAQMNSWEYGLGLSHPVFAGMSAQTTHYGGMGMPTVIVLGGGSAHTVFYNELGHSNSDNPVLITAVNDALAAAVGVEETVQAQVGVSPNPVSDVLNISDARWTKARVTDVQGRELLSTVVNGRKLDVNILPVGSYVLRLTDAKGAQGIARFEKK